jgi:hypothetical protein
MARYSCPEDVKVETEAPPRTKGMKVPLQRASYQDVYHFWTPALHGRGSINEEFILIRVRGLKR